MASQIKRIPAFGKDDLQLYWIDIDEIYHIAVEKNQIIYYTKEGAFLQVRTLEDYSVALERDGFIRTDRGSLVSLDKVTYYDSTLGKIYFDDPLQSNSHYATVSRAIMSRLIEILPREKDVSTK